MSKPVNRGHFPRYWTEAMEADLRALTSEGRSVKECAAIITERHGRHVGVHAVKNKRHGLGIVAQPHKRWTQEADDAVYSHAATMTIGQLRGHIQRETGVVYSDQAIKGRIRTLGITKRESLDEVIVTDMAQELGVHKSQLGKIIRRRNLPARKAARYTYLPIETQEALRAIFPRVTEPTMTTAEAARALGFCQEAIVKRVKNGSLVGYKFGGHLKVSVASVEALRRAMGIARPLPQTFGRPTASKRTAS